MPTEYVIQDQASGKFATWYSAREGNWVSELSQAERWKTLSGANKAVLRIVEDACMIYKIAMRGQEDREPFAESLDCQIREVDITITLK